MPHPQARSASSTSRRRWLVPLVALVVLGGLGLVLFLGRAEEPRAAASLEVTTLAQDGVRPARDEAPVRVGEAAAVVPVSGESPEEVRRRELELWMKRLERAELTLARYRESTRFPPGSRPIAEHPDQAYPRDVIESTQPLARLGGEPRPGGDTQLKVRQERVFLAGDESVRFSVAAQTGTGSPLPVRVVSAMAFPPPDDAAPPAAIGPVPVVFNDEGADGDEMARDGVLTARLRPAQQGFARYLGPIRVEVAVSVGDEEGGLFFDVFYTPRPPASFTGNIREALEGGSLVLHLGVNVHIPGRYVVTGRVDDGEGRPFALVTFNDPLSAGAGEVGLTIFGKLILEEQPAFPLKLRDVDAFLLMEDTHPDRQLLPRLAGYVHTTRTYPPTAFSPAEWESEERARYLAELGRDVDQARGEVKARQH